MYPYTAQELHISGYQDEPVPHRFLRRDEETDHALLLLPGADVFFQTPVLYYCSLEGMRRGADILWVGYHARPQFSPLSLEEKGIRARHDTAAAYQALLKQRPYRRLTLIGKSLGTLAMGHLLTTIPVTLPVRTVWLTPLLRDQQLRAQICQATRPSLFVIGTQDHQYDPAYVREVQECCGDRGQMLVIEGVDHGLGAGVGGAEVLSTLQVLEQVMHAILGFLDEAQL